MEKRKAQECSIEALISTSMLSGYRVLELIKRTGFSSQIDERDFREAIYLTYYFWASRYPDHVFDRAFEKLKNSLISDQTSPNAWALKALRCLSIEFLTFENDTLTVNLNVFGAWQQSIASRISTLPVQAYTLSHNKYENIKCDGQSFISPYDSKIEEYIHSEGLNETHLHLNGSTRSEVCWLRALASPKTEIFYFSKCWNSRTVESYKIQELTHSVNPNLNPTELFKQLTVARNIRELLIAASNGNIDLHSNLPVSYFELENINSLTTFITDKSQKIDCLDQEVEWIRNFIKFQITAKNTSLDSMFLTYILLMNQYNRLLVQSEEQFGFDQFQKLTFTDLREPAEKDYYQRFLSMHGKNKGVSELNKLEGRFAPKLTISENVKLLNAILIGYLKYLRKNSHGIKQNSFSGLSLRRTLSELEEELNKFPYRESFRLILVAHFIKKPWKHDPTYKAGPYRFYGLIKDIENRLNVLIQTLRQYPNLNKWLVGIDAAANELHAPPEVFSSIYRISKTLGIKYRTYHVGEDFPHLVTGLRWISDAVHLLDFQCGDRLGHVTAMGISPGLWVSRMPSKVILKRSEWLLDLLFVNQCSKLNEQTKSRVKEELQTLAKEIFDQNMDLEKLTTIFRFRNLNIGYLIRYTSEPDAKADLPIIEFLKAEAQMVIDAISNYSDEMSLLAKWYSDQSLWKRSEEFIEVSTDFLTVDEYIKLQQDLMTVILNKNITLETLPSSNVRISQYNHYLEHHASRWLHVDNYSEEPKLLISLGSDDPGIFAGDLKGEFYQLYSMILAKGKTEQEALEILKALNKTSAEKSFNA